MAKQGMKRPEVTHLRKNSAPPVPEIQGKAKHGNDKANPIIAGTTAPELKVWHTTPHPEKLDIEEPIPSVYPEIDTDLARDNLENDITAADLQDIAACRRSQFGIDPEEDK